MGNRFTSTNGVDVTLAARMEIGLTVQGGLSTGSTLTDNCDVTPKLDNPNTLYCRQSFGVVTDNAGNIVGGTQVKLLTTYTIPRVDVQIGGSFQSVAGGGVQANYVVPNALIQPSLGRPLAGGAPNVTVNLIEPGTMYGDRVYQVDLRFAKVLTLGGNRVQLSADLFNALNANPVTRENYALYRGNMADSHRDPRRPLDQADGAV